MPRTAKLPISPKTPTKFGKCSSCCKRDREIRANCGGHGCQEQICLECTKILSGWEQVAAEEYWCHDCLYQALAMYNKAKQTEKRD